MSNFKRRKGAENPGPSSRLNGFIAAWIFSGVLRQLSNYSLTAGLLNFKPNFVEFYMLQVKMSMSQLVMKRKTSEIRNRKISSEIQYHLQCDAP